MKLNIFIIYEDRGRFYFVGLNLKFEYFIKEVRVFFVKVVMRK